MKPLIDLKLKNADLFRNKAYVDGQWIEAKSGQRYNVIDPGTGEPFATCSATSVDDVDDAVKAAETAFATYKKTSPNSRSMLLTKLAFLMRDNLEDLSRLLVYETGVPLVEARIELDYTCTFAHWFAGEAERADGTFSHSHMPGRRNFTIKQPIGVVAALLPWNFPISMVIRKVAGAFAVGCTVVLKPSPETPFTALAIAHLMEKAGFPKGVFNVLPTTLANTPALAEALCKHPVVRKVTFTGSIPVGKLLATYCAANVKKLTLELGGNCPYVIFDDANLELACKELAYIKFTHSGQLCITANRVYIQRGVYDKCATMLADMARGLRVGYGLDETTTMGPLSVPQGLDKVVRHIEDAKSQGGTVVAGGNRLHIGKGYFFEPTVITNANPSMKLASEETFGPVMALFPFDTEEEVVKAANDTNTGLASYFFTSDASRLWRLFENLEAGVIGLNSGIPVPCQMPFGGIKDSGYGKESGRGVGIDEFLITKTGLFAVEDHY